MFINSETSRNYFPPELLVIAPLLALTTTLITSLAASVIFFLLIVLASILISAMRNLVPVEVRVPVVLLVLAALVNIAELLLAADYYILRTTLGIYLPLIGINALTVNLAEEYFLSFPPAAAARAAVRAGLVFACIAVPAGIVREFLVNGALLTDMALFMGDVQTASIRHLSGGLPIIAGPAGAFLVLGILFGVMNRFVPAFLSPGNRTS